MSLYDDAGTGRGLKELLDECGADWGHVSLWVRTRLQLSISRSRPAGFVTTAGGFVVLGADLVDVRGDRLVLEPAGTWWRRFEGRRLPTGPGRPWTVHALHGPGNAAPPHGRISA